MVKVLVDIHIAEAKANHLKVLHKDSSSAIYRELEKAVFKKNKISKTTYLRSYKYYTSRPEEMDDIYSRVVDSLSLRQKIRKLN